MSSSWNRFGVILVVAVLYATMSIGWCARSNAVWSSGSAACRRRRGHRG